MADNKRELQDKYRAVFCGGQVNREVLGDLLKTCHFGQTLDWENPGQIAEFNLGVVILAKCGILRNDNFQDVINSLCAVSGAK